MRALKYKNLKTMLQKSNGQITLSNLISGRFYHKSKGYVAFKVEDYFLNDITSIIGGRGDYSLKIRRLIAKKTLNYGIFERVIFDQYGWNYCAGQDYRAELNTIRKILREEV